MGAATAWEQARRPTGAPARDPGTGLDVPLDALVNRTVVAFRYHPHVGNVMTHIASARWDEVGRALRTILDPAAKANDLSPLAENIIDLMCAERGITGRILKPYFHGLLDRMLPAPLAARLRASLACLFDELQTRRSLPLPDAIAKPKEQIMTSIEPQDAGPSASLDERIVDVREINPRIRHTIILQLFENLDRDSSLQLIADHAPEPLHLQLQARYGAGCGWTYLETGPDVWRVRLRRGTGSPAPEPHAL
jgi:uncharacterized protein (DUF2249 family)